MEGRLLHDLRFLSFFLLALYCIASTRTRFSPSLPPRNRPIFRPRDLFSRPAFASRGSSLLYRRRRRGGSAVLPPFPFSLRAGSRCRLILPPLLLAFLLFACAGLVYALLSFTGLIHALSSLYWPDPRPPLIFLLLCSSGLLPLTPPRDSHHVEPGQTHIIISLFPLRLFPFCHTYIYQNAFQAASSASFVSAGFRTWRGAGRSSIGPGCCH